MKGIAAIEESLKDSLQRIDRMILLGRFVPTTELVPHIADLKEAILNALIACSNLKIYEVGRDHDTNETVDGDPIANDADTGSEIPASEDVHYLEATNRGSLLESASVRKSRIW